MRLIQRILPVVFVLLGTLTAWAQFPVTDGFDRPAEWVDTLRVRGLKHDPKWVVKLNPLSWLDFESIYRVDVERMLGGQWSVQGGFGYGNEYANLFRTGTSDAHDRETWRGQLEGRFYTRRDRPAGRWQPNRLVIRKPLESYFALEVFYKQVNGRFDGSLGRACDTGTCQFFQQYTAEAVRYVLGTHVKMGQQTAIRLSEKSNRLLIDYYAGFGMRWRQFVQRGVPEFEDARPAWQFGADRDPTSNFGTQAGRSGSLAFGIQIGYAF